MSTWPGLMSDGIGDPVELLERLHRRPEPGGDRRQGVARLDGVGPAGRSAGLRGRPWGRARGWTSASGVGCEAAWSSAWGPRSRRAWDCPRRWPRRSHPGSRSGRLTPVARAQASHEQRADRGDHRQREDRLAERPSVADRGTRERRSAAVDDDRGGPGDRAERDERHGGPVGSDRILVATAGRMVAEAQPALGLEPDRDGARPRRCRRGRARARRCASGRSRRAGTDRSCAARRRADGSRSGVEVIVEKDSEAAIELRRKRRNPGDDLCSRKAALSVSSALESLTSVFGMGTGVASPLESPGFPASGRRSAWPPRSPDGMRRRSSFDLASRSRAPGRRGALGCQPLTLDQLLKRSSPRPLVRLSFIRHRTSTCRLSSR